MESTSHDQNLPVAAADTAADDGGGMADQPSSFSSDSHADSHEDSARYFIRPSPSAERSTLGLNLSADDLGGNADDGGETSSDDSGGEGNDSARRTTGTGTRNLAARHRAQHEQHHREEDSTASAEDAPATAAANEVATLPVPSLSVEAIDVLIANADQPHQSARSSRQPTPIPPPRPQPAPPTAAAIVRSIASYLSLSDAESIGSLACTPHGTTIGLVGAGSTPRSVYSHSSSVASRRSRLSSGMSASSRRRLWSRGSRSGGGAAVRPPSSVRVAHHHDDADAAAGGAGDAGGVGGGSISRGSAGRTPVAGILHRSRTGSSAGGGGGGSVSWAGGDGLSLTPAPGRVSLDDEEEEDYIEDDEGEELQDHEEEDDELDIQSPPFDEESMRVFRRQQRKVIQQKLTAAVMSHPHSIRSYCLEAQRAASEMKSQRLKNKEEEETNKGGDVADACATNLARKQRLEKRQRVRILRSILNGVLSNVPLSVIFDLAEATFETSLDTTVAAFKITAVSIDGAVSVLASVVSWSFDTVTSLNPFVVVGTILAIQRDAAYHATDALVSGIQSVATGVGSAGTISMNALNVLSRAGGGHASAGTAGTGIAGKRNASTVGIAEQANFGSASRFLSRMNLLRHGTTVEKNNKLSDKLYRKLSKVDSSSRVLSYIEREDDAISQHGRKRVQRMMHYHISLRPFVATVSAPKGKGGRRNSPPATFDGMRVPDDLPTAPPSRQNSGDMQQMQLANSVALSAGDEEDDDSEPFMFTPKSFPPTPNSRANVMARGFRFSEDVVFLARDQLRVHGGLDSDNPQTRAMARALKEGSRLAVFDINDPTSSVALSCGQHVAQKVGNDYYCSTRSMIPILRNCYVYFEMSVAPPPHNSSMFQLASLSVGLSTLEMPLNALVGQWKGSIGLCTTGQILVAGQWSSPLDPRVSAYGNNSTVGCLVYLDDESAFETWDGTMVTANVTFSVNGRVIETQAGNMPFGATHQGGGPPGRQQTMNNIEERDQGEEQSGNPSQQDGRGALIMPLYVPREEEVYATLTLHSPETQVMARFSADDILARSRANIGVPEGVAVYAVDGSVVLTEEMNEVEVAAANSTGMVVNGNDDNDDDESVPPVPSLIEDE